MGLILAGLKWFLVKLRLKKEIKTKDAAAASLKEQVNTLKTELEVFQHDPYIKKEMEEKTIGELPVLDQPENDNEKGDKSDAAG